MISAVVATYGRLEVLKRTLPTVLQQDIPSNEYEVVVVIDGPDPATYDWLRGLSIDGSLAVVQQDHLGLAAARNSGLRKATGEVVLLLDDDILCDPRLVRAHADAHRKGRLVALGPVPVSQESPRTITMEWVRRVKAAQVARLSAPGPNWPRDLAICGNYSAPRELLLSCGGFDESFVGACEEFDLGIRIRRAGVEFLYLPDAVASEIYVKTAQAMVRNDCWARGRNEVRLCRKHPEFRPVSALARFSQGSRITRLLRQAAVRAPFSLEAALAPMFRAAEAASRLGITESLAMRLLEFRRGNALFRSAKQEVGSWEAFRNEFSMKLPVLLYHHVGPGRVGNDPDLSVSRADFERQMDWLASKNYATITPSQWLAWTCRGKPLPPRAVMLTFDDDSAELPEYVFPVLQRYGFSAAAFIATGRIGKGGESARANGSLTYDAMTEEQIRLWSTRGIEFGSRARIQSVLTTLRASELEVEIASSADDIERLTSVRPIAFAYPSGLFNPKVQQSVSKVFPLAFTAVGGFNCLGTDLALLSRSAVLGTDSMFDFGCRVRFGMHPFKGQRTDLVSPASGPVC